MSGQGVFRGFRSSRWICWSCQRGVASVATSANNGASLSKTLPQSPARTRFAPSPTGYLHLGSLRTALFNYLLAKSTGGQFLLRIEDTDQKRTIVDAEERLCQDLLWAGLQWDEGPNVGGSYGPYKQSQRTALYREHAEKLLDSGHAYRCFCKPERLHALAKSRSDLGLPTDYDRACIHISGEEAQDRAAKGEPHVVRLKAPAKYPEFRDLVYGLVRNRKDSSRRAIASPSFDDLILLKSDGFPTYHLANVVDDHHMRITHVVRGAEWMSSTPKHLAMYDAFGWHPPAFAHVGLLMDQNRQKLSKRNLDLDISAFRDKMGIFPEALTNFVALLGWSHGRKKDIMNLQELVKNFSMKFTTGDTVVTFDKLLFLQKAHAASYADSADATKMSFMTEPIKAIVKDKYLLKSFEHILAGRSLDDYINKLVTADARNYTNAPEFVERNIFFFTRPTDVELSSSRPRLLLSNVPKQVPNIVEPEDIIGALSKLGTIPAGQWTATELKSHINLIIGTKATEGVEAIKNEVSDVEMTNKALIRAWATLIHGYIRWAVTAKMHGPDGAATMDILGRSETLDRLSKAAKVLLAGDSNASVYPRTTEVGKGSI